MSHLLKFFLGFILASTHCLASVSAQPNPTLSRDDNGFVTLQWLSLPGHTYFMQCSFDLVTWTYFGEVIHSGFGIEKITFDPTDDHIFFRIVGSDIPTYDAVNDDFNGDGISNGDSIDQGIDPLTPPPIRVKEWSLLNEVSILSPEGSKKVAPGETRGRTKAQAGRPGRGARIPR